MAANVKKVNSEGTLYEVTTIVTRPGESVLKKVSIVDIGRGTCTCIHHCNEKIPCVCILLVGNVKKFGVEDILRFFDRRYLLSTMAKLYTGRSLKVPTNVVMVDTTVNTSAIFEFVKI